MLAESLAAWLLLPVVVVLIGSGLTLLLERVARFRIDDSLLAPVGLCIAIVVAYPAGRIGAGATVGAACLLVAAGAGLFLARRELPARLLPRWPLAVAALAYLLYLAPVIFNGEWTWTGYNFVNDTAVQMLLTDWFAHHGGSEPTGPVSTTSEVIRVYLDGGYPIGTHALLGDLERILVAPIEALYQPFISVFVALAAAALWRLARLAGLGAAAAAAVALGSVGANLTYQYALQGNIKEVGMFATFAISAALARELLTSERPVGMSVAFALCLAAGVFTYSTAALPYLGVLALLVLVGAFVQHDATLRPFLRRIIPLALAVLLLLAIPILPKLIDFAQSADATFVKDNPAESGLGHLLEPLPFEQVAGVWLEGDYRLDVRFTPQDWLTDVGIWLVFALLAIGVVRAVQRREMGPLLLLVPAAAAWLAVSPRVSPYADAKLLAIGSAGVVFAAGMGIAALGRLWRFAPVVPAVLLVAGLAWSDALAFREVKLAPIDRMRALEDLGDRYDDEPELMLFNEFEEFAVYFARDARINIAAQAITPRQIGLREPQPFGGRHFDLDDQLLDYVEDFKVIVLRRAPDASRPPADYSREYVNDYYEVWRRDGARRVSGHLPIGDVHRAAVVPFCPDVVRFARAARRDERLVAARRPSIVQLETAEVRHSPGWLPHPYFPGTLNTETPGQAVASLDFPAGAYEVWVRGSFGRTVEVRVDGRRVADARGPQTPGQWHRAGATSVTSGRHRVELVRGGGNLRPGSGYEGELGPVAFVRDEPPRLVTVDPAMARKRLCGREWDWIERVAR